MTPPTHLEPMPRVSFVQYPAVGISRQQLQRRVLKCHHLIGSWDPHWQNRHICIFINKCLDTDTEHTIYINTTYTTRKATHRNWAHATPSGAFQGRKNQLPLASFSRAMRASFCRNCTDSTIDSCVSAVAQVGERGKRDGWLLLRYRTQLRAL